MAIGLYEESRWLKSTLRKMKIRKVMGFDRILIEVWKCLAGMDIGWLTNFLGKLHFATLNYYLFFNPSSKLPECTIYPSIGLDCMTITPYYQNPVKINGKVKQVTRT
jgi:hypothetical protein